MYISVLEKKYLWASIKCCKGAAVWPWPESKRHQYILRVALVLYFISCTIPQVARVVCFFSTDVLLEQIAYLCATAMALLKFGNYVLNADKYEKMISGIRNDWSIERPQKEMDIIVAYAERGHLFVRIYLIAAFISFTLFLQMPITPRILDIVLPKNESRDLAYVYPAYYAVDEHKYHVYIIAHMYGGITWLAYIFIGCDTSFMVSVQHACGLLAIAGYRYETAVGESVNQKCEVRKDELYRRVCHGIQGHQYAIKYLKIIQEAHDIYLFIGVGMIMASFSVSLVKVSHMDMCTELVKDYAFVVIQLVHVLYLTLQGQFIINSLDKITERIYSSLWYNSDARTQLLFVLSLRNCLSHTVLTAGGLITLNLQSFSDIIKASVSYFTVLKTA